jgi:hypothetical protein
MNHRCLKTDLESENLPTNPHLMIAVCRCISSASLSLRFLSSVLVRNAAARSFRSIRLRKITSYIVMIGNQFNLLIGYGVIDKNDPKVTHFAIWW